MVRRGQEWSSVAFPHLISALEKGVDILSKQPIEMALHVGDIGESREPEKTYVHHFNTATRIMDKMGVPWFLTFWYPSQFCFLDTQDRDNHT